MKEGIDVVHCKPILVVHAANLYRIEEAKEHEIERTNAHSRALLTRPPALRDIRATVSVVMEASRRARSSECEQKAIFATMRGRRIIAVDIM